MSDAGNIKTRSRTQFIFTSDRDKRLKPALKEVLLNHVEMSCAKHIEANVTIKYGKQCGKHVMAMAKTFSVHYFDMLLEQVRASRPNAASYIENIMDKGIRWSNLQCIEAGDRLPPCFGIVISNPAESVISMFNSARNLSWMEAIEQIIDVMVQRICGCRKKYEGKDGFELVAYQTSNQHSLGSNSFHFGDGVRGWQWDLHNQHVRLRWRRRRGRQT